MMDITGTQIYLSTISVSLLPSDQFNYLVEVVGCILYSLYAKQVVT